MRKGQRLVVIETGQLMEAVDDENTLQKIDGKYSPDDPDLLFVFSSMLKPMKNENGKPSN